MNLSALLPENGFLCIFFSFSRRVLDTKMKPYMAQKKFNSDEIEIIFKVKSLQTNYLKRDGAPKYRMNPFLFMFYCKSSKNYLIYDQNF